MTEDQVNLQTAWEKVLQLDKELESLKKKHQQLVHEYAEYRLSVKLQGQALLNLVSGSL